MSWENKSDQNEDGGMSKWDHFTHLWNLLKRSNFYASTLLYSIKKKQENREKINKRRSKRYYNKSYSNSSVGTKYANQYGEVNDDVQLLMNELLIKVEAEFSDLLNDTNNSSLANQSILSNSYLGNESLFDDNQPSYVHEVLQHNVSDITSSAVMSDSDIDSDNGFFDDGSELSSRTGDILNSSPENSRPAFSGSNNEIGVNLLENNQEVSFDDFLSGLNKNTNDDFQSELLQAESSESSNCNEGDYLRSLLNRRGRQSSPKLTGNLSSLIKVESAESKGVLTPDDIKNKVKIENTIKSETSEIFTLENNGPDVVNEENLEKTGPQSTDKPVVTVSPVSQPVNKDTPSAHNESIKQEATSGFEEESTVNSQENFLQSPMEKVSCPICEKNFSVNGINRHLDVCTGRVDKHESLRRRHFEYIPPKLQPRTSRSTSSSSHKKDSAHQYINPAVEKLKRMPTGMENLQAALEKTLLTSQTEEQRKEEKEVESLLMQRQQEQLEERRASLRKRKRQTCATVSRKVKRKIETRSKAEEDENTKENSPDKVAVIESNAHGIGVNIQAEQSQAINSPASQETVDEKNNSTSADGLVKKASGNMNENVMIGSDNNINSKHNCTKSTLIEQTKCKKNAKLSDITNLNINTNNPSQESDKSTPTTDTPNKTYGKSDKSQVQIIQLPNNKTKEDAENMVEEESTSMDVASNSPVIKPRKPTTPIRVKFKRRRARSYSSSEQEESEESSSENDEVEERKVALVVEAPRRSSRSVKKITYNEPLSSEDEQEVQHSKKKQKVSSKSKSHVKKKKKSTEDDEYEISDHSDDEKDDVMSNDESAENKPNNSQTDEEGEIGVSDIDVEELLRKKFYRPDTKSVVEAVEDIGGIKYFNDQMVNPAQPKLLSGGLLRDYQITGYQWLKIMYENGESGILADEMGLGKTIQAISMVCKLVEVGVNGPFLICVPTTTITNWFYEFKKFAPKLSLLLYHGTAIERYHLIEELMRHFEIDSQVVVITSYDIFLRDRSELIKYNWAYLVLDEGHRVKNTNSKTIKELKKLTIRGKLMLTGTPVQNNLTELWSLLNFLLPSVFDDMSTFRSWFHLDVLQKDEKVLSMLHQVLTPFVLRRAKSDVDIKIPPKREMLVMAPLASLQDKLYRATVEGSIRHLLKNKEYYHITPGVAHPDLIAVNNSQEDKGIQGGDLQTRVTRSAVKDVIKREPPFDGGDFVMNVTLNNMIMQLRKCCNHPYLIQYPLMPGSDIFRVDEDLVSSCGKMMLLDRMLPVLKRNKHKVLLFSQMTAMLDVLQDYCVMREFPFLRFDGSTKCEDRFAFIDEFNNDPNIFIFLLSTRAGGLGINLTGADTVIIYDSDWNPQNDCQAQDRCHRIGQERPVMVYRMVTMATIDQQITERAAEKRRMEKMIMHQDKFKGKLAAELNKVVSPDELLHLLQTNAVDSVVENKENVISDEELHQLLDRSNLKWGESETSSADHTPMLTESPKARFQIISVSDKTISV